MKAATANGVNRVKLAFVPVNVEKPGKSPSNKTKADSDLEAIFDVIEIDKHVPMPGKRNKYPWSELQPGDSFFVPGREVKSFGSQVHASSVRTGHGYTTRTVVENGVRGVRVWRTK